MGCENMADGVAEAAVAPILDYTYPRPAPTPFHEQSQLCTIEWYDGTLCLPLSLCTLGHLFTVVPPESDCPSW